ncbi:MAG: co-chaperone GroES [Candidatus Paceibacterota bacterium]
MAKKGKVNIQPLGSRVLLKELSEEETETTTAAGIIIPETVSKEAKGAKKAKVVAVGPGEWNEDGEKRIPLSVKKGDMVLFSWGEELEVDGEEYHIVNESNILAIVE